MRVLLIEDDSATAQSIELMLQSEGFNVYTTDLGEEGVDLGKLYDYDIILLDLNLPDMSGYEVLKTLRVSKVQTPILILSGLAGIEDKVRGLGFGADDYMTKPFHKDELVARIHAIVRRSKGHAQSVIETGELKVNLDTKTVEVNDQRVHLTSKEYQMLELLSLRKGTTLTKEMFLNHLYGGMDEPELKIIDVFICKLRKKLQAATGGQHYIETVWGRGYVLRDPDRRARGGLSAPAHPRAMADFRCGLFADRLGSPIRAPFFRGCVGGSLRSAPGRDAVPAPARLTEPRHDPPRHLARRRTAHQPPGRRRRYGRARHRGRHRRGHEDAHPRLCRACGPGGRVAGRGKEPGRRGPGPAGPGRLSPTRRILRYSVHGTPCSRGGGGPNCR